MVKHSHKVIITLYSGGLVLFDPAKHFIHMKIMKLFCPSCCCFGFPNSHIKLSGWCLAFGEKANFSINVIVNLFNLQLCV